MQRDSACAFLRQFTQISFEFWDELVRPLVIGWVLIFECWFPVDIDVCWIEGFVCDTCMEGDVERVGWGMVVEGGGKGGESALINVRPVNLGAFLATGVDQIGDLPTSLSVNYERLYFSSSFFTRQIIILNIDVCAEYLYIPVAKMA